MSAFEDQVFTTPEVAAVIGKTVHKTIAYVKRGFIKPSIRDASGHGSKRLWSYLDVVRTCLIERLEFMGTSVPKLREIGSALSDDQLSENRRLIIRGPNPKDIVDVVAHTIEGEPTVPHDIAEEEIRFDISPVTLVVSMHHLHQLAQDGIKAIGRGE